MSPMAAATDARRVVVEESAAGPGAATEIVVKPLATDGKPPHLVHPAPFFVALANPS